MKKILLFALMAMNSIGLYAQCGGVYIESNAGGDNGFNSCMDGTTVDFKIGPSDYAFTPDSKSTWYAIGGTIIEVDGKAVTATSGFDFSLGYYSTYTINFDRCFKTGVIGAVNNCMQIPVKVKWDRRDRIASSGYKIMVEVSAGAFNDCFKKDEISRATSLVTDNRFSSFNSINITRSTAGPTIGTYTGQIMTPGGLRTVTNQKAVFGLSCENYGLSGNVTQSPNATYTWSVDPWSTITSPTNSNYFVASKFSNPTTPIGIPWGNYINLQTDISCKGTQYDSYLVIRYPTTPAAASITQGSYSSTSTFDPRCDNKDAQINLPYISSIATYTINTPAQWVNKTNNTNAITVPANGSPISVTYTTGNVPGKIVPAGNLTINSYQGCGGINTQTIALKELNSISVALAGPNFVTTCLNTDVTFSANITGGNPPFADNLGVNNWTNATAFVLGSTVTQDDATALKISFQNPAKGFMQYSRVVDSKGCIAYPNPNRIYYAVTGPDPGIPNYPNGKKNGGWLSGQLADVQRSLGSNISSDNVNDHVYFAGQDGKLYYYYFDNSSSKWVLSAPLVSDVKLGTPSNITPILFSQDKVYYLNSSSKIAFISKVGGSWPPSITPTVIAGSYTGRSNSNIVAGNTFSYSLYGSEDGNIYFTTSAKDIMQYTIATNTLVNFCSGCAEGKAIGTKYKYVYYVNNYGNGIGYKHTSGLTGSLPTNNTSPSWNTNFDFSTYGDLYFVTNSNEIVKMYIDVDQATGLITTTLPPEKFIPTPISLLPDNYQTINCNGSFGVNKSGSSDGTIYYIGSDGNLYQLVQKVVGGRFRTYNYRSTAFNSGDESWSPVFNGLDVASLNKTNLVTGHAYYVGGSFNALYNLYNNNCLRTTIYRQSDEDETTQLEYQKNYRSQLFSKLDLEIFPNPTDGNFKLSIPNIESVEEVVLYDSFGNIITRKTSESAEQFTMKSENKKAGMYLIEVRYDNGKKLSKKVIIE